MKNIVIVGAGGFGREIKSLIDSINRKEKMFNFLGYYDDSKQLNDLVNDDPILGKVSELNLVKETTQVVFGIGDPKVKSMIVKRLTNDKLCFPTLIDPSAIIGLDRVAIGKGCIICAGVILTCNIEIKEFVTLNLKCSVGHDTLIGNYSSFMPGVNISGEVIIHDGVYVGTGATIINQKEIGANSIIGAGAVVSKNIPMNCTAVGLPAKPIKFHKLEDV